jgi:hypothetical protein
MLDADADAVDADAASTTDTAGRCSMYISMFTHFCYK